MLNWWRIPFLNQSPTWHKQGLVRYEHGFQTCLLLLIPGHPHKVGCSLLLCPTISGKLNLPHHRTAICLPIHQQLSVALLGQLPNGQTIWTPVGHEADFLLIQVGTVALSLQAAGVLQHCAFGFDRFMQHLISITFWYEIGPVCLPAEPRCKCPRKESQTTMKYPMPPNIFCEE